MDKAKMREANRARKYIQETRSNIALLRRSKHVRSGDIEAVKREATHYLEYKYLTYPPTLNLLGITPEMSFQQKKQHLSIPAYSEEYDPYVAELEAKFQEQSDTSRRALWMWRIGAEALDMASAGWYPFFVTLTLDPDRVADTQNFWKHPDKGKSPLQWYCRQLCNIVTGAMGHPRAHKAGVPESEYVRHVAVIEHGSSRKHHHLHGLFWLRDIPPSWKRCPNRDIRDPKLRIRDRCLPFEAIWPWSLPGLSPVKYFRHQSDVWSKLGFCVAVQKNGKPFRLSPPMLAGVYLGKYLKKEDREWTHRVKATRNLGLTRLFNHLHKMRADGLEPLTWRPKSLNTAISLRMTHSIPIALLRRVAAQILFSKKWDAKQVDFQNALSPISGPYQAMKESVKTGLRIKRMPSGHLYAWVSKHLPVEEGYCERRLKRRHQSLHHLYPAEILKQTEAIPGLDNGLA